MKKSSILLLAAFITILLLILGVVLYTNSVIKENIIKASGYKTTDIRMVAPFDEIYVMGGFHVTIRQDSVQKVEVKVDESFLELISTEVTDGILYVKSKGVFKSFNAQINISFDNVNALSVGGGTRIESEGSIALPSMVLSLEGGCRGELEGSFTHLTTYVEAGSSLYLHGKAHEAAFYIGAGSVLNAGTFIVEECQVEAYAGSRATVFVEKYLTGAAQAGGVINYHGSPELGRLRTGAGGSISPAH